MPDAKLTIYSPGGASREVLISSGASIGRAPDNTICIEDTSVSRYHAVIEERAEGFWLSDLGSVNGTIVNGNPITSEYRLQDGDLISISEASRLEFHSNGVEPQVKETSAEPIGKAGEISPAEEPLKPELPQAPPRSGLSTTLIVTAVAVGLTVTVLAALLLTGALTGSGHGTAHIVSPQSGTTIRAAVPIQIEVDKTKGIERVIYQLDGVEFESAEVPPYNATIDPARLAAKLPGLAVGNHVLSVTIEDQDGNKRLQPDIVLLAFDIGSKASTGATENLIEPGSDEGTGAGKGTAGAVDLTSLAQSLASQISQKSGYVFDREFAEQIRMRTDEYRIGMIDDARRYRREIIKAFRDRGLHPLLGFVMAMSQSKFKEATEPGPAQGGVGLWRMPPQIAQGYLAPGESGSAFSDPKRSAEIAAAYMKDLLNVFGMDDFMYAIACYGMPLGQAGQIRTQLEAIAPDPTARGDFWKMVKSGVVPREGADRVERFFAAGIVGENPQAFGLRAERLSSLY